MKSKIHLHHKQVTTTATTPKYAFVSAIFIPKNICSKKERSKEKAEKRTNTNKMIQMNNLKCESQSMHSNAKGYEKVLENKTNEMEFLFLTGNEIPLITPNVLRLHA